MRADYLVSGSVRNQRRGGASQGVLLALDSDGTVLDSMTPKHLEAFAPAFARHFAPGAEAAAREVWRFVNLESRSRGVNRYRALVRCLNLLSGHPGAGKADPDWARTASVLEAWLSGEASPSRSTLEAAASAKAPVLRRVLSWTVAVDEAIAALPKPRPFQGALDALPALAAAGEVLVLTAAPQATVRSEWKAAGILGHVAAIDGQERGPKAACLAARRASLAGGGSRARILVVGDAPGDLEAARSAGAAFFPVIPGREEECWRSFLATGLDLFLEGESSPGRGLLADFLASLPQDPPWLAAKGGREVPVVQCPAGTASPASGSQVAGAGA